MAAAAAAAATRKPRVLMLPGYTQNSAIFAAKIGAIRKAIKDSAELVFVDPPHIVNLPTNSSNDFDSTANAASTAPADIPRAWWFAEAKEDYSNFSLLEETVVYMRKVLEEQGPFDGVWGFSQGAAMAAMVASLVERPSLHPVFAAPGKDWPPAPFKFAIIGSGFLPMDPRCAPWFSPKVETPSLHILGRADTIVGEDRSMALVNAFVDPRVERHDGGHHTPSKASWRHFFKAYLETEGAGEIASPVGSQQDAEVKL